MRDKLRVAIVGAGGWGFQHARAFSEREDVELAAIFGRSIERTKKRADYFHVPYYTDVKEMIRKEKPDFVSVCLPAQHTFETTMAVIEEGVPLLVEKPLAYKLEEAEQLVQKAEEKNLFFAIDFEQRYSIPCLKAKEAIMEGKLGTPVFAHWRFGHGWGSQFIDHPHTNLIEAQCHGINMLESLVSPMESVMAEMTENGGRKSFSTFTMAIRFKNGAVGSFLATLDANEHNPLSQMIEIGGTDGRILIEDNVKKYTFQKTDSDMVEVWSAGFFEDDKRCFQKSVDRYIDDMLNAFKAGKEPPVHAREGLRALKIANAAIASYQQGKRILID